MEIYQLRLICTCIVLKSRGCTALEVIKPTAADFFTDGLIVAPVGWGAP